MSGFDAFSSPSPPQAQLQQGCQDAFNFDVFANNLSQPQQQQQHHNQQQQQQQQPQRQQQQQDDFGFSQPRPNQQQSNFAAFPQQQQQQQQQQPPKQQNTNPFDDGSNANNDFSSAFSNDSNGAFSSNATDNAFSNQTSNDFDAIFGDSSFSAPTPVSTPVATRASAPPPTGEKTSNGGFDDFFQVNASASNLNDTSILDDKDDDTSRRWSVGGSFANNNPNYKSPANRDRRGSQLSAVSDDEDEGGDYDDDDVVPDTSMFNPRAGAQQTAVGRKYAVVFENERRLGMLLERHDEYQKDSNGRGKLIETTIVKMVVDHGAADVKGVKLGSRVVSVNNKDCRNLPYLSVLDAVKNTPRPMKIVFSEGKLEDEDCVAGYCLLRKSVGPLPPSSFNTWKRKFFVLGGAVANKNVLQIYRNKADYEKVVVSLFEKRAIDVKFKAYQLNREYRISSLKQQGYRDVNIDVFFFGLMAPGAKFKMIKFGSDKYDQMEALHQHVLRFGSLK